MQSATERSRANDVQRRNVTSRHASINCSHKKMLEDRWKKHTAPSMLSSNLHGQAEGITLPSNESLRRSQSQSWAHSVHGREPYTYGSPPLRIEKRHSVRPHSLARTLDQVSYCVAMTPVVHVIKFQSLSSSKRTPPVYTLSLNAVDKRCSTLRLSRLTSRAIV